MSTTMHVLYGYGMGYDSYFGNTDANLGQVWQLGSIR